MASLLDALIQVESGGIPGRRGPQTRYGQPLGLGQTLPGTAREMALKLGLEWRPDLLTSPTPEGAEYQRAVSQAYLDEGMERTGNPRDALRYYHGGPNRRLWGPKTNAYADKVLGLAGPQGFAPQEPPRTTLPEALEGMVATAGGPMNMDEQIERPTSLADILAGAPGMADARVQKPGAFDKGGIGRTILGIIADGIAGGFGRQGGFAPTLLAEKERNQQLELWREKVAQDRAERLDTANSVLGRQIALEQWKRDNPEPPDPTNAARMLIERGFRPGTPEFQRELGRYMNRPIMVGGVPYGYDDTDAPDPSGRTVVRTGTDASGRRVVQYSDGTIDYAD